MPSTISRRHLLQGGLGGAAALALPAWAGNSLQRQLQQLEHAAGITLGLWALDTGSGKRLAYRADKRFAFCSTFKAVLVGAVLHKSQTDPKLLERQIPYDIGQLVVYSPVTEKHTGAGMTVAELCAAALQYSDNTAGNLLLELVGGPAGLTAFARRLGDPSFRLDRNEPTLNSALPGDPRDTTTAQAMGVTLQRLLLTNGLPAGAQDQLRDWLKGNTTGDSRIRAGVPQGWVVGDKTGSGDYGVANDVAIIWPKGRAPWILVVFSRAQEKSAAWNSEVIAQATRVVVDTWKG
ncbi:MAG: class A beta-lactamase [Paucimonas sp.]|jgi:beta-lactamase class A|uniref:class A beta-lactamase n=1 Tax=Pantoea sp. Cy-639 TaxID=2608360 RepID=UPI0014206914|nr:class A beta-lactamase [Pantoea sp. Cy-639]MDR2308471.1 class A beta-lactamase [Paucimonas sp.]NIF15594.1 class A beta-lactamase [Pantoea sp. Cy-639]